MFGFLGIESMIRGGIHGQQGTVAIAAGFDARPAASMSSLLGGLLLLICP